MRRPDRRSRPLPTTAAVAGPAASPAVVSSYVGGIEAAASPRRRPP